MKSFVQFVAIAVVLGSIAAAAPRPVYDDRTAYVDIGRAFPLPDCWSVHCGRVLVALTLEHLPGRSAVKWKTYAVLANAGAAIAIGRLALLVGLPPQAASLAAWIAALGWGSQYTLFDSYTSDPLMYLLGPVLSLLLLRGRRLRAVLLGTAGVFAKEFAAVPLWIFTIVAVLKRRWDEAAETLLAAMTVTLVWFAYQAVIFALYNYSYGGIASLDIRHGGYLGVWLRSLGVVNGLKYLFTTFGALYVLFPIGLLRGSPELRLIALAAAPAVAVFVFTQQPERALWNFHFVMIPIAVVALGRLPRSLAWLFVACFGAANLRSGAQLPLPLVGRLGLIASMALASMAAWHAWTNRRMAVRER